MTHNTQLAILGMGYLMAYLKPCYHHLLGKELSQSVIAMTRTASTIAEKESSMGFPVICGQYLETLTNRHPDIILFSPPPSAAKSMTTQVLVPYYQHLRAMHLPLPDLYVFPPSPIGTYYLEQLGSDAPVVNLLPNMSAMVNGRDIHKESYSILTFADKSVWSDASLSRLYDFFSPLGYTLEMPITHTTSGLGCFICSHITQELTMAMADGLHQSRKNVASCMRAHLLRISNRHFEQALPCSLNAIPEHLRSLVILCTDAWINGMKYYNREVGMDDSISDAVIHPQVDIFLQCAQELTNEEIEENNAKHATKGGILEKGLKTFFSPDIAPDISKVLQYGLQHGLTNDARRNIAALIEHSAYQISRAVAEHGAVFGE